MKRLYLISPAIIMTALLMACAAPPPPTLQGDALQTKAAPVVNSWDELVKAAQKEGSVNLYGSDWGPAKVAIQRAFKAKFGIDIEATEGRATEVVAKIKAERRAGLYWADAGLTGNGPFFADIKPMGITVPLSDLLVLPEVTDPGKWRNGKIPYLDEERHLLVTVAMANRPSIHNTEMVKEGEITSFLDYLGPKWKGKMVLSDPAVPGAALSFITLMAKEIFGAERTLEILRQLAAQEPVMTRDQRMMLEWVARGKYPVGIGQSSTMFTEFKKLGAPIAFTILKEPPFLASGAGNLFVFDKAPHPNAVKLFVNWLLSKEGASVWAPAQGFPSQRMDVPTDSFDPLVLPPAGASVPDETYLRTQAEIRDRVGEIFAPLRK